MSTQVGAPVSNETQIALLGQKMQFLGDTIERLEKTMNSLLERYDKRDDAMEEEIERIVIAKVKALIGPQNVPTADESKSGKVAWIVNKPWFGYFLIATIPFLEKIIPAILTAFGWTGGSK